MNSTVGSPALLRRVRQPASLIALAFVLLFAPLSGAQEEPAQVTPACASAWDTLYTCWQQACSKDEGALSPHACDPMLRPPAQASPLCSQSLVQLAEQSCGDILELTRIFSSALPDEHVGSLQSTGPGSDSAEVESSESDPDASDAAESTGTLNVAARPSGSVYIDEVHVGESPLRRYPLTAGPHDIRVFFTTLGQSSETRIVEIRGGVTTSVFFRETSGDEPTEPEESADELGSIGERIASEPSERDLTQTIACVDDGLCVVERAVLLDPSVVTLDDLTLQQAYSDGVPSGIRLYGLSSRDGLSALGLRNGDILQDVDGVPTTTPDELSIALLEAMQEGSQIEFTLSRRGVVMSLTWVVIDVPDPTQLLPETTASEGEPAEGGVVELERVGGEGGIAYARICPTGWLMLGLRGRSGSLIDSLEVVCGTTGEASNVVLQRVGGEGGAPYTRICPLGCAVNALRGGAGSLLDRLVVVCAPIDATDTSCDLELLPAGGEGGSEFERTCPTGHFAIGLHGAAGSLVDSIELVCAPVGG